MKAIIAIKTPKRAIKYVLITIELKVNVPKEK